MRTPQTRAARHGIESLAIDCTHALAKDPVERGATAQRAQKEKCSW